MQSKRLQIIKHLENNPDEIERTSEAVGCSIQYVYKVKRTQEKQWMKRGKRSKLTNKTLAETINDISFDEQGEPTAWSIYDLKEALADKRISLSTSQLTRIIYNAGFKPQVSIARVVEDTQWYSSDIGIADRKDARRFRNTILILDVIKKVAKHKFWFDKKAGMENWENKLSMQYFVFKSLKGELLFIVKADGAKLYLESALSALHKYFQKQKRNTKFIIVDPRISETQSPELKKYLKDNESSIIVRRTSYYTKYSGKEMMQERYTSGKTSDRIKRKKKEEEKNIQDQWSGFIHW